MADKELSVRVCHAYATSAQWSNANPVLMSGEMGVESDTQKYKIGDGVTRWSNLSYASGVPIDTTLSASSTNPVQNKVVYNLGYKFFSRLNALADVARTGSYSDLTGTPGNATATAAGLMSAADKAKLDKVDADVGSVKMIVYS